MNREEAKEQIKKEFFYATKMQIDILSNFIDKIQDQHDKETLEAAIKYAELVEKYDELLNRTCESCKHYHQEYLCLEVGDGFFKPEKDFSCNRWEEKE